jgi:CYTH domain-containing protein
LSFFIIRPFSFQKLTWLGQEVASDKHYKCQS